MRRVSPLLQGSSKGESYAERLQPIRLNEHDVDWEAAELSYLQPQAYRRSILERLEGTMRAMTGNAERKFYNCGDATHSAGLLCKLQSSVQIMPVSCFHAACCGSHWHERL